MLSLALLILASNRAYGVLGECANSIESDRVFLSAKRSTTRYNEGFSVQQIDSNGTVVREYISPSGIVFGIAWNGILHPDLSQLLGAYAGQYQEALQKTPRRHGRRHVQIKADKVIVEKWGHMRNLQGRAYVPDLIPPGVSVADIN